MYNLNVNLATAATAPGAVNSLLMIETGGATPRTPEILNSLMAMTNPLDNYNFTEDGPKQSDKKPFTNTSSDSNSSSCSQLESPTNGPTSVQQTCSQLIKAGLKLSIEQKRKFQSDTEDILDLDRCTAKRIKKNECSESEEDKHNGVGLTPEDEERRRRRRERNKIAATKCRLKKREKTANLVTESETLEAQNIELKTQITQLQNERRQILGMLETHRATCQNNVAPVTRDFIYGHRLPSMTAGVIETNHSYSRPASVDTVNTFRSRQNMNLFNRPASVGNEVTYSNTRQYGKMPSIVVDSPTDSYHQSQLTELETSLQNSYHQIITYNNQQCHNYGTNSNNNYNNPGIDNGCMA